MAAAAVDAAAEKKNARMSVARMASFIFVVSTAAVAYQLIAFHSTQNDAVRTFLSDLLAMPNEGSNHNSLPHTDNSAGSRLAADQTYHGIVGTQRRRPVSVLEQSRHRDNRFVSLVGNETSMDTGRPDTVDGSVSPNESGQPPADSGAARGRNEHTHRAPDSHGSIAQHRAEDADTRYASSIPRRSQQQKELAQRCVRAGQGGIFFKHFRKAGGTALGGSIRDAACAGYTSKTKPSYGSEYPYLQPSIFSSGPDGLSSTVFVTSLRHPVDRIISMYWFEGRWPRICGAECERNRAKTDATKVADLGEWVEHVHAQTDPGRLQYIRHSSCGQWISVENYYIRMLLGVDAAQTKAESMATSYGRGFLNVTLTRRHLEQAKRVLDNFDLVMIQEQMLGPSNMTRMFHGIIGSTKRNPYSLPVRRKGEERSSLYVPPTKAELDRLRSLNELDIELYEYAVGLTARTVDAWTSEQSNVGIDDKDRDPPSSFNASTDCHIPDQVPPMSLKRRIIGGVKCSMKNDFYYYGGRCMLHSHVPATK